MAHGPGVDWRLTKPKMHSASKGDLPPDAAEFVQHVRCEHGGLSANVTARRKISPEVRSSLPTQRQRSCASLKACRLLQELFPSWKPIPTDTEPCAVCEAIVHISKEDRREYRRQAEEEKVCQRYATAGVS